MANPNRVIRSEAKPETKGEISERMAKSGPPGHARLTLKSKPVPFEILARTDGTATGEWSSGFIRSLCCQKRQRKTELNLPWLEQPVVSSLA
jgi:hypothetical protein